MSYQLPEWSAGLFQPKRYKNLYGGRGGAKSHTIAAALLVLAARKRLRVGCFREFQNSIHDSVHTLLKKKIEEMSLGHFFTPLETTIRGRNGSEFLYGGLRTNLHSIKSKEDIDIAWIEEAQTVSEKSWEILIPTIRKSGSEIWLSWNPENADDPTYKRFVSDPPRECLTLCVNHDDNPWFPDELRAEMERLYATDPEAAEHIWGGKTRRVSLAQVLRGRYVVESFEPGKDWHGPYYGADWGFAADPTTLVRCWIYGRELYIEHEAYGVGIDLDDTPALFDTVPGARKHTIRADCARPETISHMRRHEYTRIIPCVKWQGSVEDGVEHLRSYARIVIHPRCTHAAEEARLWSYKVDKLTGDVLPVLADKHDHLICDATRYALEPIIRSGKPLKPLPKPEAKMSDYDRKDPIAAEAWKVS